MRCSCSRSVKLSNCKCSEKGGKLAELDITSRTISTHSTQLIYYFSAFIYPETSTQSQKCQDLPMRRSGPASWQKRTEIFPKLNPSHPQMKQTSVQCEGQAATQVLLQGIRHFDCGIGLLLDGRSFAVFLSGRMLVAKCA